MFQRYDQTKKDKVKIERLQEYNKIKMKGMEDRLESLEALLKEQNKRISK